MIIENLKKVKKLSSPYVQSFLPELRSIRSMRSKTDNLCDDLATPEFGSTIFVKTMSNMVLLVPAKKPQEIRIN